MLHTKGHQGRLCTDVQFPEKARQKRIGHLVVNHESGIHRDLARPLIHHHRVGMPAQTVIGFKQSDLVLATQEASTSHACDSRADDGNAFPSHAHPGWAMLVANCSSNSALAIRCKSMIKPTHQRRQFQFTLPCNFAEPVKPNPRQIIQRHAHQTGKNPRIEQR